MDLVRGRVYLANLGEDGDDPKYWLVVSNNGRNRGLGSALAVRITSTRKYEDLPSVVPIPTGEPLTGWVRCDSLTTLYDDEPIRDVCAFSTSTMRAIEAGLRYSLGL